MNLILSGGGEEGKIAVTSDYLPEGGTLANRIAKYQSAKLRSLQMLAFLENELKNTCFMDWLACVQFLFHCDSNPNYFRALSGRKKRLLQGVLENDTLLDWCYIMV